MNDKDLDKLTPEQLVQAVKGTIIAHREALEDALKYADRCAALVARLRKHLPPPTTNRRSEGETDMNHDAESETRTHHHALGRTKYGWCWEGDVQVPYPDEQQVMDEVVHMRENKMGLDAIAAQLDSRGKITRYGKRFNANNLSTVLNAIERRQGGAGA